MTGKSSRYEKLFRQQSVWKAIFSMAIPALLTIVIMIFYNMADMFFIAQLGNTAKVASVSIISCIQYHHGPGYHDRCRRQRHHCRCLRRRG